MDTCPPVSVPITPDRCATARPALRLLEENLLRITGLDTVTPAER